MRIPSATMSIKKFCADCAGSADGATSCSVMKCDLWPYRIGKIGSKAYETRCTGLFSRRNDHTDWCREVGIDLPDFLRPTEGAIKKTCLPGDFPSHGWWNRRAK